MATHFILQALDETRDPNDDEPLSNDDLLIAAASLLDDEALTLVAIERALTRRALRLTVES